jgi:DNA-directed RNA polymerase subunit N (RpoN/RPB10)
MPYTICPTCGALLSNIKEAYDQDMKKLCDDEDIDHELMSRKIIYDEKLNEKKKKIMDKYTDPHRICCRMRLGNAVDSVDIVR